jgi:hypothetical protein
MVQTLLTGRLEASSISDSDEILIVINDVVAGVAYLARDTATGGTITGLVAEELVRDGANDVDILIPDGNGAWLAGVNDDVSLELVAEDGHVIELGVEGSRRIQVDSVVPTDNGWELSGWAADVSQKLTPDTFYVFVGDRLLASGPPNADNRNVVRWFASEDLLRSGFRFEVEGNAVPAEADRLLVVAEFGDVAVADPATLGR